MNEPKKPVPFPISISEIMRISGKFEGPKSRSLKALYYGLFLTGCRISEILSHKPESYTVEDLKDGRRVLLCTTKTLKNKRVPFRRVPIPMYGLEKDMAEYYLEFILSREEGEPLWKMKRKTVGYHFRKINIPTQGYIWNPKGIVELPNFKLHPHYLRHSRLTDLVVRYDYGPNELMQFAGWSDLRQMRVYVELDWKRLLKPMEEK